MSHDFNANEVFEIAEQIERNGAKFYRNAAESIADADKKKLLIDLAEMEDEHEKTFITLRADLTDKDKVVTIFDPEDEAANYLRALADTRVFYEKDIDFTSLKEILMGAIAIEKDSIAFYTGMKNVVPIHLGKVRLDRIIREEMGHFTLLSNELVALTT